MLDVNRCDRLQSIGALFCLFFCMCNTDLNIYCKLAHGCVCSEWCRWRYTTESKIICHRFAAFGGHCSRFWITLFFFALEMKHGDVVELLDAAFQLIHFSIIPRNNCSEVDACS